MSNRIKKQIGFLLLMLFSVNNGFAASSLKRSDVLNTLNQTATWQILNFKYVEKGSAGYLHDYGLNSWTNAVFYIGLLNWAETSGNKDYMNWLYNLGEKSDWTPDQNFKKLKSYGIYHADELCVGQYYLHMSKLTENLHLMDSTRFRIEMIMANQAEQKMNAGNKQKWTWCDALFMAPALYSELSALTGNKSYVDYMHKEFLDTYHYLFSKNDSLFFRDDSYFSKRENNGQKVFWGRGNGWVVAGIAQILKTLPENSPYRPFYEELLRQMLQKLLTLQDEKGFWHASLLDPESYPAPESSATAMILYAMSYGLNNHILEKELYLPVVERTWNALVSVVSSNGKLGFVQPIGANPRQVTRDMSAVYGVGAFLLAGSEVYKISVE